MSLVSTRIIEKIHAWNLNTKRGPRAKLKLAILKKKLNSLLLQARICLRTGKLDWAAHYYSRFSSEYGQSSSRIKEKFKDAAGRLKEEVKRKMT